MKKYFSKKYKIIIERLNHERRKRERERKERQ